MMKSKIKINKKDGKKNQIIENKQKKCVKKKKDNMIMRDNKKLQNITNKRKNNSYIILIYKYTFIIDLKKK